MNDYIRMDLLERNNTLLRMENEKLKSNQDYIAIMCDVDLSEGEEDEQELRED